MSPLPMAGGGARLLRCALLALLAIALRATDMSDAVGAWSIDADLTRAALSERAREQGRSPGAAELDAQVEAAARSWPDLAVDERELRLARGQLRYPVRAATPEAGWLRVDAVRLDADGGPAVLRLRREGDALRCALAHGAELAALLGVYRRADTAAGPDEAWIGDEHAAAAYAPLAPGLGGWGGVGAFGTVAVVLQLICVVHMLRARSDPRWFLLVLFAPVIGAAAYLLIEGRRGWRSFDAGLLMRLPMMRHVSLRRMEQAFALQDTVANRMALAEAYLERGRVQEALALYRPALSGTFRNDVVLLLGYAKACYAAGDDRACIEALARAEQVPNNERLRQRNLLMALAHERVGEHEAADARFAASLSGFDGEEARCRYGLFLERLGRLDDARRQFSKVVESAAISTWRYRRMERFWIRTARERLAAIAS